MPFKIRAVNNITNTTSAIIIKWSSSLTFSNEKIASHKNKKPPKKNENLVLNLICRVTSCFPTNKVINHCPDFQYNKINNGMANSI